MALSCLMAVTFLTAAPLSGSAAGKNYSTDFNSADDLKDWRMQQADAQGNETDYDGYEVKDGMMVPKKAGQILGAVYTGAKYKNVLIETSVDKATRIEFCCDTASPWADKRFYVEIDFGGAVLIRTGEDQEIASQLVSGLVSREQTEVKIRIYGKTIEVYLNGAKTPSLKRVDEDGTFTATEGYIGIMTVWQNPSIDYFRITELDENGMLDGKDPITGKGSGTSNTSPVSSAPAPSSTPAPSSAPAPVSSVPDESTAVTSSEAAIEPAESSEASVTEPASSAAGSSTVTAGSGTDEGSGLSGGAIAGIIIAVIVVLGGGAAGLYFYLKRKKPTDQ